MPDAWRASEKWPINSNAMMVPIPAGSAQAAYRSHGIARIEVGRQHVCDRRKRCIGKRGEPEKHRDEVQIYRENCRDEKQHADAAKNNQRFTRGAQRPAAPNQVSRNATAEKMAQVRR